MPTRRRARQVCVACHDQKLRCDLDGTNIPCSRCAARSYDCVVRSRRSYPVHRAKQKPRLRDDEPHDLDHGTISSELSRIQQGEIVAAAVAKPDSRRVPIFVGNGGYGDILGSEEQISQRHFLIPAELEKSLALEDLSYLRLKGCFTLPTEHEDLLKAYFIHVHPVFPIIDASAFTSQYNDQGIGGLNLLLTWSMFSVAANYVPIFQAAAVKESFVMCAKLLFDLTNESDKVVLVQSALLLSFWFKEAEDSKQSWYWTAIAFSIAQAAGFDQDLANKPSRIHPRQLVLWRELWRSCLYRDVWMSFSMGRPLRLSVMRQSLTEEQDLLSLFQNIRLGDSELFSVQEAKVLSNVWQDLNAVSQLLRQLLDRGTKQSYEVVSELEALRNSNLSRLMNIHESIYTHLVLHIHAALIYFYRTTGDVAKLHGILKDSLQLVQRLILEEPPIQISPAAIPLLLQPMLAHLQKLVPDDPRYAQREQGTLDAYLDLLGMFEGVYPSAAIIKRLFKVACTSAGTANSNTFVNTLTSSNMLR